MGKCFALAALLLAALATGLSGCARYTDTIGPGSDVETFALYGARTIKQRFVAHHAGLVEVAVMLQAAPGAGPVTLHLREDTEEGSELATVTIDPPVSEAPTYHAFALPVQDDVNGESLLLLLEAPQATADAAVLVAYSAGISGELDLWLDGDLSRGRSLSFQLHYDPVFIVKDLVRQASTFGLRALWQLLLSALFYLLPGGALVVWLLREGDWIERTVVALGMSVAVYALLVYATMTGLRLGRGVTYGFLAVCAGLIVLRWWLDGRPLPSLRGAWAAVKADLAPVALAFVLILVVAVRIFVVRDLVAPMWGDGYHHTMISQLLVDNRGLFDSWEPYAPLTTFTYHFGFHANVALYHWLSGEPVIQSVIWIGQMMNVLAVLALYPLAVKVSEGNRWAGVVAVLVAGLLSPMPMYYVNWSRYTQLAGQVILPVLMTLMWSMLERSRFDLAGMLMLWLGTGGLALTHYRVLLLFAVFLAVCGVWFLWRRDWVLLAMRGTILLAGSLLLFLPWLLHLSGGIILLDFGRNLTRGAAGLSAHIAQYNALSPLSSFMPATLWLLMLLAAMSGLWRRVWGVLLVTTWCTVLLFATNPHWLSLPGTGAISNFALFISAYIPSALLVGDLSGWSLSLLAHRVKVVQHAAMGLLVVLAVLGARRSVAAADRGRYALLTLSDLRAMVWIREHTPIQSRFLVNGMFAYGDTVVVGTDGGWWLPLLTRRATTLPPILYAKEESATISYREQVNGLWQRIETDGLNSESVLATLRAHGVTHVYIGERQGTVNDDNGPALDAAQLQTIPAYTPVYRHGDVWVFELGPE